MNTEQVYFLDPNCTKVEDKTVYVSMAKIAAYCSREFHPMPAAARRKLPSRDLLRSNVREPTGQLLEEGRTNHGESRQHLLPHSQTQSETYN